MVEIFCKWSVLILPYNLTDYIENQIYKLALGFGLNYWIDVPTPGPIFVFEACPKTLRTSEFIQNAK